MAEISTTDTSLSVYGIWEEGVLRRMVMINSEVHLKHSGSRKSMKVGLHGWREGQTASVKRLYTPHTDAFRGL